VSSSATLHYVIDSVFDNILKDCSAFVIGVEHPKGGVLDTEDEGIMLPQNADNYLSTDTTVRTSYLTVLLCQ
jgi:hypothetical protein